MRDLRSNHLPLVSVFGDPEIARIFSDDQDELMPPAKSNRKLTEQQKQLLKQWVAQGAPYQQHWTFVAPPRHAPRMRPGLNRAEVPARVMIFQHTPPNATIRDRCRVGSFAVVGLGAVVTKDVPDLATVVGSPARAREG